MARSFALARIARVPRWTWLGALMMLGCQTTVARQPALVSAPEQNELRTEIVRLAHKIDALEQQLQQERRVAARSRIENREQLERLLALEGQLGTQAAEPEPPRVAESTDPSHGSASLMRTMEAEAELRHAFRSLTRAIERMEISPEEKSALKNSLKPTRALDQNPWARAQD